MDGKTSRYRFLTRNDGFRIEAANRVPVDVSLCETGFRISVEQVRQLKLFEDIAEDGSLISESSQLPDTNLVQYRRLADLVAKGLMSQWQPPRDRRPLWKVRQWAVSQTRRALGGRMFEQWRRLVAQADPSIWGVQKAVFAAGRRTPALLHEPLLYQDRYLTRDIQRYRAAAALVTIADELCQAQKQAQASIATEQSPEPSEFRDVRGDDQDLCQPAEVIACLANWQDACSPTGAKYPSLSRTLMRLPGGIPCSLLFNLRLLYLERPLTDRLELVTLLLARERAVDDPTYHFPAKILFHATRQQIRAALGNLSKKLRFPLSHRRTRDIGTLVEYLLDFPDEHRGGLSGLLRKSIAWHEALGGNGTLDGSTASLCKSMLTKRPPIPLPKSPGVRFLGTVGDVLAEGEKMGHCIASYAARAVAGRCYLFHVNHNGYVASVELDSMGLVRQAYGPRNESNPATAYATRILGRWGKKLFSAAAASAANDRPF